MRTWLLSVAAVLVPSVASAQPAFEAKGKAEDVKDVDKVTWTAKAELGFIATTGNAKSTTVSASGNGVRKDKDNKLEITVTGTRASASTRTAVDRDASGGIGPSELSSTTATSAENAAAKLRYDRYLSPLDALYVAALAGVDRPAGKDLQAGGQIGYSRSLYRNDCHEVLGELGYDLSYLSLSAGSSSTIHSGRVFAGYKGKLRKDTALEASMEALINGNRVTFGSREATLGEATRLIGIVGVTSTLASKVALNVSFTARYDNFPTPLAKIGAVPFEAGYEPASEKLDTMTKVSLIVTFL